MPLPLSSMILVGGGAVGLVLLLSIGAIMGQRRPNSPDHKSNQNPKSPSKSSVEFIRNPPSKATSKSNLNSPSNQNSNPPVESNRNTPSNPPSKQNSNPPVESNRNTSNSTSNLPSNQNPKSPSRSNRNTSSSTSSTPSNQNSSNPKPRSNSISNSPPNQNPSKKSSRNQNQNISSKSARNTPSRSNRNTFSNSNRTTSSNLNDHSEVLSDGVEELINLNPEDVSTALLDVNSTGHFITGFQKLNEEERRKLIRAAIKRAGITMESVEDLVHAHLATIYEIVTKSEQVGLEKVSEELIKTNKFFADNNLALSLPTINQLNENQFEICLPNKVTIVRQEKQGEKFILTPDSLLDQ
jgi:hypothetical protein